jgi:hypothetical protein
MPNIGVVLRSSSLRRTGVRLLFSELARLDLGHFAKPSDHPADKVTDTIPQANGHFALGGKVF